MERSFTAGSGVAPPSGRPPQHNLASRDVEALTDELVAYHAHFAPLFQRAEQRTWALAYLHGQLLDLDRKSIEPMALALEGGDVQAMQQFISLGAWDDERVLEKHQDLVADTLGDAATGVLILDGCDFPKQGSYSVGVARQWCGTPEDISFRTRPDLAADIITTLRNRQVLPFQWVTCDEAYGQNPAFLDTISALSLYYLAEVPHDTGVWVKRPPTAVPARGKRGPVPTRERLTADAPAPVRV